MKARSDPRAEDVVHGNNITLIMLICRESRSLDGFFGLNAARDGGHSTRMDIARAFS